MVGTGNGVLVGRIHRAGQPASAGACARNRTLPGQLRRGQRRFGNEPATVFRIVHDRIQYRWQSTQQAAIQATGLAPASPNESAVLMTLTPGAYTVQVDGTNGATGIALIETFLVTPTP